MYVGEEVRILPYYLILLCAVSGFAAVPVTTGPHATPREQLGVERLRAALNPVVQPGARVVAGTEPSAFDAGASEAFHLLREATRGA